MGLRNRILRKLRRERSMVTPEKLAVKLRADSGVVKRVLQRLRKDRQVRYMSLEQSIHQGK